ncbi:MAG TPA: hypothetical protein VFL70_04670 [Bacteroidia bacterium]|nr:hypothetical protein [Bacteroidia bacterium]
MKKKIYSILLILFFTLLIVVDIHATGPPGPPMGGGGPTCWPPPCGIPLDGGLSILIAAGVGLAGKKFYDSRKKNTE